jgi:peptidylprolyl isomerase
VPDKKSKREYGRCLAVCLVVAALVGGCGDSSDSGSQSSAAEPTETQPTGTATAPAPSLEDTSQKPVVEKPTGPVPRRLKVHDIVKGTGPAARDGDELTIQYVGVTFSTGDEFDSSWDSGEPYSFQLGNDEVIPGWDKGLKGMRKGGRRELTIPPKLAYGAEGSPPAIGPNETLVFVLDLVDLR